MLYALGAGVHSRYRLEDDVDVREINYYIETCSRFEEKTGIIAYPASIPALSDHEFWYKVKRLIAKNESPDVLFTHYSWFADAIKSDLLLDLRPYLNKLGLLEDDFYPSSIAQCESDGRLLVLPRETSSIVLYFNRSLFEEKGLPTPDTLFQEGRWTWDAFLELAKSLSGDGNYGCIAPVNVPYAMLPLIRSFGGHIFNETQERCTFDSKKTVGALEFIEEMVQKGYALDPAVTRRENLFAQGRVGMVFSGFWEIAVLEQKGVTFEWDITHLPKGEKRVTRVATGGYAIPKASLRRDEALCFVKHVLELSELEELAGLGVILPARVKATKQIESLGRNGRPRNSRVFLEALNYGEPDPMMDGWPDMIEVIDEAFKTVWTGERRAVEVCRDVTRAVNDILAARQI